MRGHRYLLVAPVGGVVEGAGVVLGVVEGFVPAGDVFVVLGVVEGFVPVGGAVWVVDGEEAGVVVSTEGVSGTSMRVGWRSFARTNTNTI